MKGDDQILTYDDYSNKTVVKQIGNSVVASGGTIQLETGYRIILYKVDELTHDRLKEQNSKDYILQQELRLRRNCNDK